MTFINYDETRTVQGKKAGAVWGWDAIVSVSESDDDTPTSIGTHIAKVFTSFTEQQKHLFSRKQEYKFAADVTPELIQPVNVYMLDEDVVALFLSLFGNHNKEELLADTKLMESYFGSVEAAHDLLAYVQFI